MQQPNAIRFSPDGASFPAHISAWIESQDSAAATLSSADELMSIALRARPQFVIFDARREQQAAFTALKRLKRDSYTAVVPAAVLCGKSGEALDGAFDAGADEVIRDGMQISEAVRRLTAMLIRSERDLVVHPSTRLAGTSAIEAEIGRRLASGDYFAVCYADLDHFKEFNDRYSYNEGDRVIRILAKLLHDVVKGTCGEDGFIGHIGGDDFIFIIPYNAIPSVCGEIVATFDLLAPYQYSEQDRRAGYFFGKDRRGHLDRVPLMTLSIGVVTNLRRTLTSARQASQLATEMKTYAKSLPGSVYTVDRRSDERVTPQEPLPAIRDVRKIGENE
ncbi:MAG TPA: diguanylate cyclase [Gemmatimonadaceae bacterium]|nr:diguanylate cyclase [Gemmatimonadaceae bacterium]